MLIAAAAGKGSKLLLGRTAISSTQACSHPAVLWQHSVSPFTHTTMSKRGPLDAFFKPLSASAGAGNKKARAAADDTPQPADAAPNNKVCGVVWADAVRTNGNCFLWRVAASHLLLNSSSSFHTQQIAGQAKAPGAAAAGRCHQRPTGGSRHQHDASSPICISISSSPSRRTNKWQCFWGTHGGCQGRGRQWWQWQRPKEAQRTRDAAAGRQVRTLWELVGRDFVIAHNTLEPATHPTCTVLTCGGVCVCCCKPPLLTQQRNRNQAAVVAAVQEAATAQQALQLKSLLVEPSWLRVLGPEFDKPYMQQLQGFLHQEWASQVIYPPQDCIFRAFNAVPLDQVFDCCCWDMFVGLWELGSQTCMGKSTRNRELVCTWRRVCLGVLLATQLQCICLQAHTPTTSYPRSHHSCVRTIMPAMHCHCHSGYENCIMQFDACRRCVW